MLYLVSGASRAGKTIVAKRILQRTHIPYMSLDWLVMGFTDGLPQYGIHDKLMPDVIAEKLWDFIKPIYENMVWSGIDYVVEGEAMLPRFIHDFSTEHPHCVEACFLGYTDVDVDHKLADIRSHHAGQGDWLLEEDDASVSQHIENMIGHSRLLQDGCQRCGARYIDTSDCFPEAVEEATTYLLRNHLS